MQDENPGLLDDSDGSLDDDDGLLERQSNLERAKAKASTRLEELGVEYRAAITQVIESGSAVIEDGTGLDARTERQRQDEDRTVIDVAPYRRQALDGAMRVLERCQGEATMTNTAATKVERLVRHQDPAGSMRATSQQWAIPPTSAPLARCSNSATARRCA